MKWQIPHSIGDPIPESSCVMHAAATAQLNTPSSHMFRILAEKSPPPKLSRCAPYPKFSVTARFIQDGRVPRIIPLVPIVTGRMSHPVVERLTDPAEQTPSYMPAIQFLHTRTLRHLHGLNATTTSGASYLYNPWLSLSRRSSTLLGAQTGV